MRKSGSDNSVGAGRGQRPATFAGMTIPDSLWQQWSDNIDRARTWSRASASTSAGTGGQQQLTGTAPEWRDFRGCEFMPPYAMEFLGVYAPGSPNPTTGNRDLALRDIELYCSQLAHDGVNAVRVWYPYQSYWYVRANGGSTCITLGDILDALHRHEIWAIVTLGNSFGTGSLENGPVDTTIKTYLGDFASPPLPDTPLRMITSHKHPWNIQTGFYQCPGNDILHLFDSGGQNLAFSTFVDPTGDPGNWMDYLVDVVSFTARPAFKACEVWNEPEGASGVGPPGNPGWPKIAELIKRAVEKLEASQTPPKLMLSASSPEALDAWIRLRYCGAAPCLPNQPGGQPLLGVDYVKAHFHAFGFHPTAVPDYHGYVLLPPVSGQPYAPGFPPLAFHYAYGLLDAFIYTADTVSIPGAVDRTLGFAIDYSLDPENNLAGMIFEEICVRGFAPQYQTDVDLATRYRPNPGWPSFIGKLRWAGATSPLSVWAMSLADGTPWHPRERQAMLNRGRNGVLTHDGSEVTTARPGVNGGSSPGDRIHPSPLSGQPFSAQVHPLVLESPSGDAVLLLWSDAFDDVATHSMAAGFHGLGPASSRGAARHTIWARAFRWNGSAWLQSAVLDLGSHLGSTLIKLSPDLSFRDLDDNRAQPANNPLPVRGSYVGASAALANWLSGDGAYYPMGYFVPLDACWGGWPAGTNPSKLPTFINWCCSSEWSPCNPIPYNPANAPQVSRTACVPRMNG